MTHATTPADAQADGTSTTPSVDHSSASGAPVRPTASPRCPECQSPLRAVGGYAAWECPREHGVYCACITRLQFDLGTRRFYCPRTPHLRCRSVPLDAVTPPKGPLDGPECERCGRREAWHPDGSCHSFHPKAAGDTVTLTRAAHTEAVQLLTKIQARLASLGRDVRDLDADNVRLRKLLWMRHGCGINALYGDDGEMQCGQCQLDFKRLPVADIEERFSLLAGHASVR